MNIASAELNRLTEAERSGTLAPAVKRCRSRRCHPEYDDRSSIWTNTVRCVPRSNFRRTLWRTCSLL
jgi:hypothetical protein